jgi:hypothetical protein
MVAGYKPVSTAQAALACTRLFEWEDAGRMPASEPCSGLLLVPLPYLHTYLAPHVGHCLRHDPLSDLPEPPEWTAVQDRNSLSPTTGDDHVPFLTNTLSDQQCEPSMPISSLVLWCMRRHWRTGVPPDSCDTDHKPPMGHSPPHRVNKQQQAHGSAPVWSPLYRCHPSKPPPPPPPPQTHLMSCPPSIRISGSTMGTRPLACVEHACTQAGMQVRCGHSDNDADQKSVLSLFLPLWMALCSIAL